MVSRRHPRPDVRLIAAVRRSRPALIAATIVAVLGLVLAGAWFYDRGHQDAIAAGISVGGVDVGGLERDAARDTLRRELLEPLQESVVVERGTRSWRLTAKEARVAADVESSVDAALARGRQGSFLTRAFRDVTGGEVDERLDVQVTYSDAAIVRLLDRIRKVVDRPARDASISFSAGALAPVPAREGRRLRTTSLHEDIRAALVSPTAERTFTARTKRVSPKVTTDELAAKYPTVITVDRSNFKLTLFKDLKPTKSYPIAVGQIGLETPAGLYNIQNKQVDPVWNVPNSDWAGDLAGKSIPPGPENPLKARWLGIFNGAGIHGTDAIGSLGTAASHGCVRMAVPDVVDLYDRVEVGTPVYIA